MTVDVESRPGGVVIQVKVTPGARRSGIAGSHAGALRISTTAPAEKGSANAAVVDILAKAFGVTRSSVCILRGASSRRKRVQIAGMCRDEAAEILARVLRDAECQA